MYYICNDLSFFSPQVDNLAIVLSNWNYLVLSEKRKTTYISPQMASLPPQQSASPQRQRSLQSEDSATSQDESHTVNAELERSKTEASKVEADAVSNDLRPSRLPSCGVDGQEQAQWQPQSPPSTSEPRKCWICFADETEDTPTSSVWRSPCPCALTAHEACLLDWVADLEAPTSQNRGVSKKIECPQCKAKITIARPHSYIVQGVSAAEQVGGKLVLPGILFTLAGSIFAGCWLHGVSSVYLVFGPEDANRLLGVDTRHGVSPRWGFGLPFIPIVLILSRTTIADNLLPILPFLFFATQFPDTRPSRKQLWPPSAAMTLATLPYIRGAYNEMFKRLFAEREKRWIKEVQPRSGEAGDGPGEQEARANGNLDVADVGFNLNLEVEIFEEQGDVMNNEQQQEQAEQGNPGPDQPAAQPQRANNLVVSTSRVADTVFGALMFPAVSAAMGAIMKIALPSSWTVVSTNRKGLLQSRWGRSIVGGCLFLVLKDTLLLYSRYRLAQDHRKRRVVNYKGRNGKSPQR